MVPDAPVRYDPGNPLVFHGLANDAIYLRRNEREEGFHEPETAEERLVPDPMLEPVLHRYEERGGQISVSDPLDFEAGDNS